MTMSVMVEELVKRAVEQLTSPDLDSAKLLAEEDDQIDQWDVRIEDTCLKILALHQPVAGDLRRIATVLKISNELERVADLGVDIAERAIGLMKGPVITIPETLPEMMWIAVKMLNQSIDAYVRLDSDLARDVFATDHHVDSLQSQIIAQLLRCHACSARFCRTGVASLFGYTPYRADCRSCDKYCGGCYLPCGRGHCSPSTPGDELK